MKLERSSEHIHFKPRSEVSKSGGKIVLSKEQKEQWFGRSLAALSKKTLLRPNLGQNSSTFAIREQSQIPVR